MNKERILGVVLLCLVLVVCLVEMMSPHSPGLRPTRWALTAVLVLYGLLKICGPR